MRKHFKMNIIRRTAAFLCVAMAVTSAVIPSSAETLAEQQNTDYGTKVEFNYTVNGDYWGKYAEYEKNGFTAAQGEGVTLPATAYTATEKELKIEEDAVLWQEDNSYIEWQLEIPSTGLYRIELTYRALQDESGKIRRGLEIDGEIPFDECTNLTFYRLWKDKGEPTVNSAGDEVRPAVYEVYDWQTVALTDTYAMYGEGLEFYLEKGTHSLKMTAIDCGMYLKSIAFVPAVRTESYSTVSSDYDLSGGKVTDEVRFEAEALKNTVNKNSSVLRMNADGDPANTPFKPGYAVMNTLGGSTWTAGASAITWSFDIKTAGYYCLGMRFKQNYRDGLPSYRRILIDGKVPFTEFENYKFVYNKNWQYKTLGNDEPYYIWLDEGPHTVTMAASQGECTELYRMLENDSLRLSELVLAITMITGQEPDPNYDYELDKYIPDLLDTLKTLTDNMRAMMVLMKDISEREPAKYHQLKSMIVQIEKMIDDPFVIATRADELNTILTSYGSWMSEVRSQPLLVDYLSFSGQPSTGKSSKFYERLWCGIVNFFMTFVKDYSNVASSASGDNEIVETLDVWIGRGTNWATLIKRMSDEEFTAETGIDVNINILPAGQLNSGSANALLLAVSSGRAPDISMGTATASVGEFSMRNAAADLSEMPDFDKVKQRFLEQLFIPMTYKGGIYGLPETLDFNVMMYRKDIVSELDIHLPDTWNELEDYVVPILYRNNMEFYLGTDQFTTFLYQNGGRYYSDDLFYSDIGSSQGYQAFKQYTDLYTLYGIPVAANFFNRFRSGEMPMGIVNFMLYMQITAAAPELVGKCGVALIPGTEREDGTIDRTYTGICAESVMIMEQSDKKKEAWEFLKWWTDVDVQSRFGEEIESLMGETARWNTANIAAFTDMAWENADLEVILKSYESVTQMPVVLGGYFTTRHITNAFNRTVVSGMDAMSSLEKAVKDIDRELKRRRK